MCSARNVELVRSLGAAHVSDYTAEDFTDGRTRNDVILDNVSSLPLAKLRGMSTLFRARVTRPSERFQPSTRPYSDPRTGSCPRRGARVPTRRREGDSTMNVLASTGNWMFFAGLAFVLALAGAIVFGRGRKP